MHVLQGKMKFSKANKVLIGSESCSLLASEEGAALRKGAGPWACRPQLFLWNTGGTCVWCVHVCLCTQMKTQLLFKVLYSSARAAITQRRWFKGQTCMAHSSGGWKPHTKVSAGLVSHETSPLALGQWPYMWAHPGWLLLFLKDTRQIVVGPHPYDLI